MPKFTAEISRVAMYRKLKALEKTLKSLDHNMEARFVRKIAQSYQPQLQQQQEEAVESLPYKEPDSENQQELHKSIDEMLNPTPTKTYDALFDMPDDGDGVEFEKLVQLGILTQQEVDSMLKYDRVNWQLIEERVQKYKNSLRLQRRYYIRFGNIVSLSRNKLGDQEYVAEMKGMSKEEYQFHKEFETGKEVFYESGMSAYYARQHGDKWMIAVDPYNLKDMLDIMGQRIKDGAIYLVTGIQRSLGVGNNPTYGSDTEPLIEDVEVIKKLTLDELVVPLSRPGSERDEYDRQIRSGNTFYEYESDIEPEMPSEEEWVKMSPEEQAKASKAWRKEFKRFKNPSNETRLDWPTLREWLHYHLKNEVKRVYKVDVDNPIEFWYNKLDEQYADWIMNDIYESGNVEEDFEFSPRDEAAIREFVKNKLGDINLAKGKNAWKEVADKVEDFIFEGKDIEESLNRWHQ